VKITVNVENSLTGMSSRSEGTATNANFEPIIDYPADIWKVQAMNCLSFVLLEIFVCLKYSSFINIHCLD